MSLAAFNAETASGKGAYGPDSPGSLSVTTVARVDRETTRRDRYRPERQQQDRCFGDGSEPGGEAEEAVQAELAGGPAAAQYPV